MVSGLVMFVSISNVVSEKKDELIEQTRQNGQRVGFVQELNLGWASF
jgi:hypothetical protein